MITDSLSYKEWLWKNHPLGKKRKYTKDNCTLLMASERECQKLKLLQSAELSVFWTPSRLRLSRFLRGVAQGWPVYAVCLHPAHTPRLAKPSTLRQKVTLQIGNRFRFALSMPRFLRL